MLFYIALKSILFFIFYKNILIESDKIVLLSSKNEKYHFETIEKIVFIERNWLIGGSQKIRIFFSNGHKKTIRCNGLSSDDEYSQSFYKTYEYVESLFQKTYYQEYYFLGNGK